RYDSSRRRECREENAKPLTIAAVAVNKAADEYLVLNDRAREDLAAGKYQDRRKSSSVTDAPARRPLPGPSGRAQARPPGAGPATAAPLLEQGPGGPGADLQRAGGAPGRDRRAARRQP